MDGVCAQLPLTPTLSPQAGRGSRIALVIPAKRSAERECSFGAGVCGWVPDSLAGLGFEDDE